MVRGSRSETPTGRRTVPVGQWWCVLSPARSGLVGFGRDRGPTGYGAGIRLAHWRPALRARCCLTMTFITAPHAPARFGQLIGTTLLGFMLVGAGLAMAYLAIATPMVSELVPGTAASRGSIAIGFGIWSFALIAGGALLTAGTNRLAFILVLLKTTDRSGGPAMRALGSSSGDLAVVSNAIAGDGTPIPELVIGSFGAAVIHELPAVSRVRHGPSGWETRTSNGWEPIDDPLDAAMRDADRVRRWLAGADLEFVVRVYAALVVNDQVLQRSPTCAVIGSGQIAQWIASLPRQRTLTAGRRARLLGIVQPAKRTAGHAR